MRRILRVSASSGGNGGNGGNGGTSTPIITPHQQILIDGGVRHLLPLDQGLVPAADLRQIGVTALPTGVLWNVQPLDFSVKTKLVGDGIGTAWNRLYTAGDTASTPSSIRFTNGTELTAFSFGCTILPGTFEMGWSDFSDFPSNGWNNGGVSFLRVAGIECYWDRNNRTLSLWNGSTNYGGRNLGDNTIHTPFKLAITATRNGNLQIYVNSARGQNITFDYSSLPAGMQNSAIDIGVLNAFQGNGRSFALRDFWLFNRILTTAELRQFSA